ncbi:hypothetical protein [Snuella sedimenti]|uniref:Lipoprotein n=1 Tax=Snuella sedimenti TaxID=2798802 RepID=A0A8J7IXJ5_9FLAO|nr:hypothetical protein [Snuella sedimenti]MBJ6369100.1 hypothetical protein [Snuella sedimenti]
MKLLLITLLALVISCSSSQTAKNEALNVIAVVYKRIPKMLMPPPPPLTNSEVKEENNINYAQLKPLKFTYAIHDHFVYFNFDYVSGIFNRFHPAKSKELFEEKALDSSYMELVKGLSRDKSEQKIDKAKLIKSADEDLIFWNKQTISRQEKADTNISGIISFSKVSFNDNLTRAAIVVGDYFGKISGGVNLYILEKINNKWEVKFSKTLEIS